VPEGPAPRPEESGLGHQFGRVRVEVEGRVAAPCSPAGLSREKFLASPGVRQEDFGLTRLAGDVTEPVVAVGRTPKGLRLLETDAGLPAITSAYTAAGTFTEGFAVVQGGGEGECDPGKYPREFTIFSDGAKKIREGEIEHCADFQYAFEISLKRYAAAVNRVARSGRTFPSQRAAEAHIARLVGAHPRDWGAVFKCLAEKTKLRDQSWHTPKSLRPPQRRGAACLSVREWITGSSLPQVGKHPPSEIIRDCGETGKPKRARGGGG
jgi:hypothetical protein